VKSISIGGVLLGVLAVIGLVADSMGIFSFLAVQGTQSTESSKVAPQLTPQATIEAAVPDVQGVNAANGSLDNWIASFKFDFKAGFWSVGEHDYTLSIDCSGTARDYSATRTFQVSENAELFQGEVYLRLEGVHKTDLSLDPISEVHPLQRTAALVSLPHLTSAAAESAVNGDCKGSISWDGEPSQPLIAKEPYRIVEHIVP
jgi:hypothetical protein